MTEIDIHNFQYNEETPLWKIEDELTMAKKKAQAGNREKCREHTEKALEMLCQTE
jgi:hypothetical protein